MAATRRLLRLALLLLLPSRLGARGGARRAPAVDAERVLGAMRASVRASAREHPLAPGSPALRGGGPLGWGAILPARGRVLFDWPRPACTKCAMLERLIVSAAQAAANGSCAAEAAARGLRIAPLAPAAFFVETSSLGCEPGGACAAYPTLVIATAPRLGRDGGIASPNPYFRSYGAWRAAAAALEGAADATPLEARAPRACWRGHVAGGKLGAPLRADRWPSAAECAAHAAASAGPPPPGALERLAAASLGCAAPSALDVRLVARADEPARTDHAAVAACWLRGGTGAAEPRALAPGSAAACEARMAGAPRLRPTQFARYQLSLLLPGGTGGGYSRHLNGLWALGSPVLLWRAPTAEPPPAVAAAGEAAAGEARGGGGANGTAAAAAAGAPLFSEWYYPALTPGRTHVEVGHASLLGAARELLARTADGARRRAQLGARARAVHARLLCPCCLVEFYSQLFEALGAAQANVSERALREMAERTVAAGRARGGRQHAWHRL